MSRIDSAGPAQASPAKQLRPARIILIGMGILMLGVYALAFGIAPSSVKEAIDEEVQQMAQQGKALDPAQLKELELAAVWSVQWTAAVFMALGVVYILFGIVVYRWPVPITITALVLFLGIAALIGLMDRTQLASGAIVKVIIVVGLWKSIRAALIYQRQTRAASPPLTA